MKGTEIPCPAIGFDRAGDIVCFHRSEDLSLCESWIVRKDLYRGMEMIDRDGGVWRVAAIELHGASGPLWRRVLGFALRATPYKATFQLESRGRIDFGRATEKIAASIRENPEMWNDPELSAGESGFPQDPEALLAYFIGRVQQASGMAEIVAILEDPYAGAPPFPHPEAVPG